MIRKFKDRYSERERIIEGEKMAKTGENTSIVREKGQKKKIIVIVTVALVCFTAIFAAVTVYTSPARQLQRQLDLGRRYLEEMDYEQAIVAFDQVIEIDPMNVDAYLGKAEAYVGMGDMETAIAVLEEGYELTQSDEILKRLEELRGSGGEAIYAETGRDTAEETVETTEINVGESGLPYFELGFSPEDFTIAGYSVMDGDHLEDIVQVIAGAMPNWEDVWEDANYSGLAYTYMYDDHSGISYGRGGYSTVQYESNFEIGVVLLKVNNIDNISDAPFWEGKVTPGITSYEDALDILNIRQIIQQTNEEERISYNEISEFGEYGYYVATYTFESQYGNMDCRCVYGEEGSLMSCRFSAEEWDLVLFIWDSTLDSVVVCGLD